MSVSEPRLPGFDRLRVFAALCVLFAHGGYFLFAAWPQYDVYAFAGWFGTELFFALAGYLLVAQLLVRPPRSGADIRDWWRWRGWRVLPLFWLALALHGVLAALAQDAPGLDAAAFVVLAQNLAWTHPAFFGEAWNLPVLMLFFLLAPVLARIAGRSGDGASRMAWLLMGWIVVGTVARAAWVLQTEPLWDAGIRKIVLSRLDACAYGGLAACIAARSVGLRGGPALPALSLWGLAAAGFFLLPRDASIAAGIGLFVLAGIGSALAVTASRVGMRTASRATAALARWSFPLYIVNMPVLLAMALLGFDQVDNAVQGAVRFVVWLALSIGLAAAVHRFVEAPLMAARARRLPRPGGVSAARATSR